MVLALAGAFMLTPLAAAPEAGKRKSSNKPPSKASTPRPSKAAPATPSPTPKPATTPAATPKANYGPNVSLEPEDLVEFSKLPPEMQSLIRSALALTKQNLTYTYGSAEPAKGGMDCSGTIYYLLRSAGFSNVPRDSAGQYVWLRKAGSFRAVVSNSEKSFEFNELQPGDLLFWSGTYRVEREFPITHVMLYLGTERKTKKRVMFGASDGRTYAGIPRWGVSVFDFRMPRVGPNERVRFVGYGALPSSAKDRQKQD